MCVKIILMKYISMCQKEFKIFVIKIFIVDTIHKMRFLSKIEQHDRIDDFFLNKIVTRPLCPPQICVHNFVTKSAHVRIQSWCQRNSYHTLPRNFKIHANFLDRVKRDDESARNDARAGMELSRKTVDREFSIQRTST